MMRIRQEHALTPIKMRLCCSKGWQKIWIWIWVQSSTRMDRDTWEKPIVVSICTNFKIMVPALRESH